MEKQDLIKSFSKFLRRFEENTTRRIRKELEKRFNFEGRIEVKDVWASKRKREDKIVLEYLIPEVGNRQIEIDYTSAASLADSIQRIMGKSKK